VWAESSGLRPFPRAAKACATSRFERAMTGTRRNKLHSGEYHTRLEHLTPGIGAKVVGFSAVEMLLAKGRLMRQRLTAHLDLSASIESVRAARLAGK
jgi:hypothetical protein